MEIIVKNFSHLTIFFKMLKPFNLIELNLPKDSILKEYSQIIWWLYDTTIYLQGILKKVEKLKEKY